MSAKQDYNFDSLINRKNTNSSKWDDYPSAVKSDDMLPMWTADMDFSCPPAVIEALKSRLEHPIFGYYTLPERYKQSIINWHKNRFDSVLTEDDIIPVASVLSGVAMAIQALTCEGDSVLVPTPGYHAFFNAINNNHRKLVTCPLHCSGSTFSMNLKQIEDVIRRENVKLFILCSPHNPTGRIWQEEELSELAEVCYRNSVYLVSDEIHADMTLTHQFTPFFKKANSHKEKIAIALYAPTKTFNIAGLCTAYAVIKDADIQKRFQDALLASGLKVKNTLGIEAIMAAYENCSDWVNALQEYLLGNAQFAVDYIQNNIPGLEAYVPEATYFLWIDFSRTGLSMDEFIFKLETEAHVVVTRGDEFLDGGEHRVRLVYACPRLTLQDALCRIKTVFT